MLTSFFTILKMLKCALITVFVLLLGSSFLFSQVQSFEHYTVNEGLSQSTGNCFLQDSEGYMWIGTQSGLNQFNGYNFVNYLPNPTDSSSISATRIFSIVEDENRNLWIGTRDGLNKFDKKTETFSVIDFLNPNSIITNNRVYGLVADNNGNILISTPPDLYILNINSNKIDHYKNSIEVDLSIQDKGIPIFQDSKGLIWIASATGLSYFDKNTKKFTNFKSDLNDNYAISNDFITSLAEDNAGNVWIGTKNGLNKYNRESDNFKKYYNEISEINSLSSNHISSITVDKNNNIWVGTSNSGLNKISFDKRFNIEKCIRFQSYYGNNNTITSNVIISLYIDRSDNLWVGSDVGISKTDLKKKKFKLYQKTADENSIAFSDNSISTIFEYNSDELWLGTWGYGLNFYNRNTGVVDYFTQNNSNGNNISNDFINTIYKDSENRIWVGTRNGMNIYNEKTNTFCDYKDYFPNANFPDLKNIRLNCIIEDNNGNILIGSHNGLDILNLESFTNQKITAENDSMLSISGNLVYSLLKDQDGDIWVGTSTGLDQFNPSKTKITHFKKDSLINSSLYDNFVLCLYQDSKSFIWIGTSIGVSRLNKKTLVFEHFSYNEGLPGNIIYDIVEDNNNDIWFTTTAGISKYSYQSNTFITFNKEDGLQGLEFNLNSCVKTYDGEIFVGGINGLNSFYPDSLISEQHIPKIAITSFEKENSFGKQAIIVEDTDTIILTNEDYAIKIQFAALDYTNSLANKYSYQMLGLSENRIENGYNREVRFLNLQPGNYIFKVFGSNNEGVWNNSGTKLNIIVLPPWWKSKIAYFLYIISISIVILMYIKLRERKLKNDKEFLEKTVDERTVELKDKNIQLEQKKEELYTQAEAQKTINELLLNKNEKILTQKDELEIKNIKIEKQKDKLEENRIHIDEQHKKTLSLLEGQFENQNLKSELKLLRAQINPHFLFNVLNNIDELIFEDEEKASATLIKLSEIMRYMFKESVSDKVLLKNELTYIEDYIDLVRLSFNNKDFIKYELIGDVKNQHVSPMIFITFVENTIKHAQKDVSIPGIEIYFIIKENSIEFKTVNSIKKETQNNSTISGTGLANVKKRLELMYQDNYTLSLEQVEDKYFVLLKLML